jgi:hypothetical protein
MRTGKKPFVFNMFHSIMTTSRFAQPGDNFPRCPKSQGFGLSTVVEKTVDNPDPAPDAARHNIPSEYSIVFSTLDRIMACG